MLEESLRSAYKRPGLRPENDSRQDVTLSHRIDYLTTANHYTCDEIAVTVGAYRAPITMKQYIKYMVSPRCKMVVKDELDRLGLHYGSIDVGVVDLEKPLTDEQRREFGSALLKSGLELLDDKKGILIEKIRLAIQEMVHLDDDLPRGKNSQYISEKLGYDYTYLANIFSESTGSTIEQYIITLKIERVKELLLYDELSLTQISYKLNYSSVAHLSSQFKKLTGLTPSFFKHIKQKRRERRIRHEESGRST